MQLIYRLEQTLYFRPTKMFQWGKLNDQYLGWPKPRCLATQIKIRNNFITNTLPDCYFKVVSEYCIIIEKLKCMLKCIWRGSSLVFLDSQQVAKLDSLVAIWDFSGTGLLTSPPTLYPLYYESHFTIHMRHLFFLLLLQGVLICENRLNKYNF